MFRGKQKRIQVTEMAALSPRTYTMLTQAGWYPGRQIDTRTYEHTLQAKGYPVHPVVVEFLREFGGLSVSVEIEDQSYLYKLFHFNAELAAKASLSSIINDYYNIRVGAHLCVIGEARNDHLTLLMDSTGHVYGGIDDTLAYFGESGGTAVEELCSGVGELVPEGPITYEDWLNQD